MINGIFAEILRLERAVENYKELEADATFGCEEEALFYYNAYLKAKADLRRAKKAWCRYCNAQPGEAVLVGSF